VDAEQVKLELLLTDARIKSQDIDHSPAGASLTAEPSVVVVLATPAFPARSEKLMEKGTAPTGSLLVTCTDAVKHCASLPIACTNALRPKMITTTELTASGSFAVNTIDTALPAVADAVLEAEAPATKMDTESSEGV